MSDLIPAKSVTVIKTFSAACHLPGCTWTGRARRTFADANADRQAHITWHQQDTKEAGHG